MSSGARDRESIVPEPWPLSDGDTDDYTEQPHHQQQLRTPRSDVRGCESHVADKGILHDGLRVWAERR